MTKKVVSVSPAQKLIDVKHIYEADNFHHHIPVIEKGCLVGIISLQDFLMAIGPVSLNDSEQVYQNTSVKEIMRLHPVTINPGDSLRFACKILAEGNIHAIVVCEDMHVKGIISTADIIRYFLMIEENEATN